MTGLVRLQKEPGVGLAVAALSIFVACAPRPARAGAKSGGPGAVAAPPASFQVHVPFQTDRLSLYRAGLLADPSGYVVVGYNESSATRRRSVGATVANTTGRQLWSRTYGARRPVRDLRALRTHDGGFLVWGREEPSGPGHSYPYLLRVNKQGESLWCRTYGRYHHPPSAVEQTTDGGFIVTGFVYGPNGKPVYLLKTDAHGDSLWSETYGNGYREDAHCVQQIADGGYVVAGVTDGDIYVMRTDDTGKVLWSRTWGSARGFDYDEGWSVQQTKDGGFVVLAWFEGPNPGPGTYLVRTDHNGDTLWMRPYGPRLGRWTVRQTADGGFIMSGWKAGRTFAPGMHAVGDWKVYVVRANAGGDTLWTRTLDDTINDENCSTFKTDDDGLTIAWVDVQPLLAWLERDRAATADSDAVRIKMVTVDGRGNVLRP